MTIKRIQPEGPPTPVPAEIPAEVVFAPIKGPSGSHPIVQEVRKRLDSLSENHMPDKQKVSERINRLHEEALSSPPPSSEDVAEENTEQKP